MEDNYFLTQTQPFYHPYQMSSYYKQQKTWVKCALLYKI